MSVVRIGENPEPAPIGLPQKPVRPAKNTTTLASLDVMLVKWRVVVFAVLAVLAVSI